MSETSRAKRKQIDNPSDDEAEEEMAKKQKLYQELWDEAETRGWLTSEIRTALGDLELDQKIFLLRRQEEMAAKIRLHSQLKAELAAKIRLHSQLKAANAAKDEQLKAKDEENLKLKAENDLARGLRQWSIEGTYLDTKKNFWHPPLNLNEAVTPSVLGKSRKINYYDKSKQQQVQGHLRIPQAKIVVRTGHHVHPVDVRIPVRVEEALIPSIFGAERYGEPFGFDYYNECGVQRFCDSMIGDALCCLNLRDVRSDTEPSIFLIKPDSVVVLRLKGKIVMAILVKSPDVQDGNRNDKVFTSESTSGQIWSYLLAMKSTGIQQPLAAVMTYNKMVLASLDSFENDTTHSDILENVKQTLSTNKAPPYRVHQVPEECQEQTASPIRQIVSVSHFKQDADDTEKEAFEEKRWTELFITQRCLRMDMSFLFFFKPLKWLTKKLGPSLLPISHALAMVSVWEIGLCARWTRTCSLGSRHLCTLRRGERRKRSLPISRIFRILRRRRSIFWVNWELEIRQRSILPAIPVAAFAR